MTTTTIVAHDAHVACRATFIAARTAMVQAAVTKRARAATRATTRAEVRATTKVVRANAVAKKEAAEKHASAVSGHAVRVANRAAHKAYMAPAVRAAKICASSVAKVLKAANALRLAAIRVQRMAAKASKTITTAVVAIDKAYALSVAPVTTPVVAPTTVSIPAIVAFLAMTPCLCALWFYATFDIAARAADKEAAKAANKVHARIRAPRVPMNTPEKRASITMACNAVRAAVLHAQVKSGNAISNAKVVARAAQGDAQRAANAARKAERKEIKKLEDSIIGIVPVVQPRAVVRPIVAKLVGAHTLAAQYKSTHVVHATSGTKVADARGEFKTLASAKKAAKAAKAALAIEQAAKWAARKEAYRMRKEAMAVIAADAWMNKGVWLSEDLIRGANDWSYTVRINAFKEARNIAYGTVALVGGAA